MAASALVTTAGSASANAYVSLAVANQYHSDRPAAGTTWANATDDQKNAAILWATTLLDRLFVWEGTVVDATQKLLWPRAGLLDVNEYSNLSEDSIPEPIQEATAEFARQLLAADRAADSQIETQGVTSMKAGPVAFTFKDSVSAKVVPDAVANLIPRHWGRVRGRGIRRLERA